MTTSSTPAVSTGWAVMRRLLVALGFAVVVVVLLLWLAGVFAPKIATGTAGGQAGRPAGDARLVAARLVELPRVESAVGTVQAVHEVSVASKLLAKVVEVKVQAGQTVRQGDVLVRLDDQDLMAQLRQAEAGVAAAQASLEQARTDFRRVSALFEQSNASRTEFDQAQTTLKTAEAQLELAAQTRAQRQATIDYATITSPIDGKVVDKRVQVGDTVSPGQVVVNLFDPTHMQLVASVRESLTHRLKVGQPIGVHIDALARTCTGQVSEIVPEAESTSRTFSVKVTGPCPPEVYSGMFGRLLIPLDQETVLVIPRAAVSRIGQLQTVEVAGTSGPGSERRLYRRAVQLGRAIDDEVEVLSGLRAGEQVAVPAKSGE